MTIVKALIEPPAVLFILALLGLIVGLRFRRTGQALHITAALTLLLLSLPIVAHTLVRSLEAEIAAAPAPVGAAPGAIVILSAGVQATDFAGTRLNVDELTLDRLRRGAALHRETGIPILLSGGIPRPGGRALADLMATSLRSDFGIEPHWLETASRTTAENALYSAQILHVENIERIFLVTQSWHLLRAMVEFQRYGIEVFPVAAGYEIVHGQFTILHLIPSASALLRSRFAIHEYIGRAWYALQGEPSG